MMEEKNSYVSKLVTANKRRIIIKYGWISQVSLVHLVPGFDFLLFSNFFFLVHTKVFSWKNYERFEPLKIQMDEIVGAFHYIFTLGNNKTQS